MNGKSIAIVIGVLVLAGGGYLLLQKSKDAQPQVSVSLQASPTPTVSPSPTVSPAVSPGTSPTGQEVIIKYTDSGYSPSTVTVARDTKVTFVNESSGLMWTASANHPTHAILPAFDAKSGVAIGSKYSFTFTSPGTWRFHDHLKPNFFGSVVVQ